MLIEFKVTNFRSFRDTQTFSMVASADQSLPENTIETPALGKQRLLRSATMYGPNASGKSNLVKAFQFLLGFVLNSTERKPGNGTSVKPFLLDPDCAKRPSEFEIMFIHDNVRYQFGLSLDAERIHNEWLIAYPKGVQQIWYERTLDAATNETAWYFGPRYTGERQRLIGLTRGDVPFLSVATAFNHVRLGSLYTWMKNEIITIDVEHQRDVLFNITTDMANKYTGYKDRISEMLRGADIGINGFDWNKVDLIDDEHPGSDGLSEEQSVIDHFNVRMHHTKNSNTTFLLPFEDESLGTQRYYRMLGLWLMTLDFGGTLIVDELDASLHPMLMRTLIQMFHDPEINKNNAQLIFNTHDTTLLDTGLFRRDQFWFVEKDRGGASHIYSLLEYSPRKDEALERGYLQGRYGAIPDVRGLLDVEITRG